MSKYKNEDANDASPFKKTLFYAAFLADITPRPGKMHHRSRKHRLDDASETVDLHPQIQLVKFPLPSEKIRILKSHNPHSRMHKFHNSQ